MIKFRLFLFVLLLIPLVAQALPYAPGQLAISPEGNHLLHQNSKGDVYLYRMGNRELVSKWKSSYGARYFWKNDSILLEADNQGIHRLDLAGNRHPLWKSDKSVMTDALYLRNNQTLVYATYSDGIYLIDPYQGEVVSVRGSQQAQNPQLFMHPSGREFGYYHPVSLLSSSHRIFLIDLRSKDTRKLKGEYEFKHLISVNNGYLLELEDSRFRLLDFQGNDIKTFKAATDFLSAAPSYLLSYCQIGLDNFDFVAFNSFDGLAILDAQSGDFYKLARKQAVELCAFVPSNSPYFPQHLLVADSQQIYTLSLYGNEMAWFCPDKLYQSQVFNPEYRQYCPDGLHLRFSNGKGVRSPSPITSMLVKNKRLYTGRQDGKLSVYSPDGQLIRELEVYGEAITSLAADKGRLYAGARGRIAVYPLENGEVPDVWTGQTGNILGLYSLPSGYLMSWSSDESTVIYTPEGKIIERREKVKIQEAMNEAANWKAPHPNGFPEFQVQNSFNGSLMSMAFHPKEEQLAVLDEKGTRISLIDVSSGLIQREIKHPSLSRCTRISYSPDGRIVLVNGGNRLLEFDAENGLLRKETTLSPKGLGALNLAGNWSDKSVRYQNLLVHLQYNCNELVLTHANSGDFSGFTDFSGQNAGILYDMVHDGKGNLLVFGSGKRLIYHMAENRYTLLSHYPQNLLINASVDHVRFSPSGNNAATIEGDRLQLNIWDARNGQLLWQGPEQVLAYDFLSDSSIVCLEMDHRNQVLIRCYLIGQDQPYSSMTTTHRWQKSDQVLSFSLSPSKSYVAFGTTWGDLRVYWLPGESLHYENRRFGTYAYSYQSDPSGRYLVFPEKKGVYLLDFKNMSSRLLPARNYPLHLIFSEDSQELFYIHENNSLQSLNLENGEEKLIYTGTDELKLYRFQADAFLLAEEPEGGKSRYIYVDRDGKQLAIPGFIREIGDKVPVFCSSPGWTEKKSNWFELSFSEDESTCHLDVYRWNPEKKQKDFLFRHNMRYLDQVFYAPAIRQIFRGNLEAWKEARTKQFFQELLSLKFVQSGEGRFVAIASGDSELKLYDITQQKLHPIDWYSGDFGEVSALEFNQDTLLLATGKGYLAQLFFPFEKPVWLAERKTCAVKSFVHSGNALALLDDCGELSWYHTLSEKAVLHLQYQGDGEVICYNDSGYYFSTTPDIQRLAFRFHGKTYPVEEFDVLLNRPEKIYPQLPFSDPEFTHLLKEASRRRNERTSRKFGLPQLESPWKWENSLQDQIKGPVKTESQNLALKLSGPANSEFRILVLVNEVLRAEYSHKTDARGSWQGQAGIPLPDHLNEIKLLLIDSKGKRNPGETVRISKVRGSQKPPRRFVLVIGMNRYADSSKNLRYCVNDAHRMAHLFGREKNTRVDSLLNQHFTLQNFQTYLAGIRKEAQPGDEFIFFYAGHGLLDKQLHFYLTYYNAQFDQPATGLSYDYLLDQLSLLPMTRKLVLLDACHSGEPDEETQGFFVTRNTGESGKRGVEEVTEIGEGSRGNSFMLMKHLFSDYSMGNGISVISASGGFESALEKGELKNGVFTYCVLQAFENNQADRNSDGQISLSELNRYVSARVMELTDGRQQPSARQINYKCSWNFTLPQ